MENELEGSTMRWISIQGSISLLSPMASATCRGFNIFILLLTLLNNDVDGYHAVVVIHGVLTGSDSMELISNRIQEVCNSNTKKME